MQIYKSINKTIAFLAMLALFNCVFTNNSYAAKQSLRVSPIINDLQLTPGKPTVIDLSVENLNETSLGVHAEVSGFDETSQDLFTDQHPSVLTKWTSISSPDIVLNPLSQKIIEITITPPKDAKQSGYYETVFLTPIVSSKKEPTSPVVLTRIGAVILATVGTSDYNDLAKKVSIQDFKPENYIFEKTPAALTFSVENKYFTHFTAKPFITIKPLFGQEKTILLEEKHILPGTGKSWKFQEAFGKNIFYSAKLAVSIGNGNQILANTWFVVLPYEHILILILLLGIIFFAVFKKDRIKKAILALFGRN